MIERVRSYRSTSNSRGPGQQGAVFFVNVGTRRCELCDAVISDAIPVGTHGHHIGSGGVRLNCVGQPMVSP